MAYYSHSGRTAKAARAIARGLECWNFSVTLAPVDQTDPDSLARYDLVCLGTPVRGLVIMGVGPSRAIMKFIERLPRLSGVKGAAFCTYGWNPEDTLDRMGEVMAAKGIQLLGAHESWMMRPDEGCQSFGELLAQQVINLKVTTYNNLGGRYQPVPA